jgi:hypothetical protein
MRLQNLEHALDRGGGVAEIDLLLACVSPAGAEDGLIEGLLRRDINWTRVIGLALDHGVSPLLAHRLGRLRSTSVPDEIREALEAHLADNRERNEQLTCALFEILDRLRASDIVALPFKGQTLGAMAFGDFALRRANDVDFLVKRRDLASTWEVLESLGYREMSHFQSGRPMTAAEHAAYLRYQCEYAFLRERDNIVVEPHWAIVPATFAVELDCEKFWGRAESVQLSGRDAPTLAAEDLLVVLCIHSAKHEWTRLQWICDVAALLESRPELDLAAILANARERGFERMMLVGLGLAHRIFSTRFSSTVEQRLHGDAMAISLVDTFARRLFTGGVETSAIYELSRLRLAMRERARDRAAYVLRTITTPTAKHVGLVALPAGAHGLYVPLKLVHDYVALPLWQLTKRFGKRLPRT